MRPKKVVLCVNDDESELSVLSFTLATHGYRVLPATSGKLAITLFSENIVDLVLTDHVMPKMSGDELVLKLKKLASHIPMVILGDPQKMHGKIYCADALLSKRTCSIEELLSRVKIMSARKRGPRKGIARVQPAEVVAQAV